MASDKNRLLSILSETGDDRERPIFMLPNRVFKNKSAFNLRTKAV